MNRHKDLWIRCQFVNELPCEVLSSYLCVLRNFTIVLISGTWWPLLAKRFVCKERIRNREYSSYARPTDRAISCVISDWLQSIALKQKLAICVDLCWACLITTSRVQARLLNIIIPQSNNIVDNAAEDKYWEGWFSFLLHKRKTGFTEKSNAFHSLRIEVATTSQDMNWPKTLVYIYWFYRF